MTAEPPVDKAPSHCWRLRCARPDESTWLRQPLALSRCAERLPILVGRRRRASSGVDRPNQLRRVTRRATVTAWPRLADRFLDGAATGARGTARVAGRGDRPAAAAKRMAALSGWVRLAHAERTHRAPPGGAPWSHRVEFGNTHLPVTHSAGRARSTSSNTLFMTGSCLCQSKSPQ